MDPDHHFALNGGEALTSVFQSMSFFLLQSSESLVG
jgi:hypothetical protein